MSYHIAMDKESHAPSPGRPQSLTLDQQILAAALELFATVGWDGFSFAEVARRARSTPPAIYRRYDSKADLIDAALRHELATFNFATSDHGTLRADVHAWASAVAKSITPKRVKILAALILCAEEVPQLSRGFERHIQELTGASWMALIERANFRGEIGSPNQDQAQLVQFVTSSLVMSALAQNNPTESGIIEKLTDQIVMPLLQPMAAPTS